MKAAPDLPLSRRAKSVLTAIFPNGFTREEVAGLSNLELALRENCGRKTVAEIRRWACPRGWSAEDELRAVSSSLAAMIRHEGELNAALRRAENERDTYRRALHESRKVA